MKMISIAAGAAALLYGAAAHAQVSPAGDRPSFQARPAAEIARLFESLSAKPGWPTRASEAEVDATLTRRGIKPEDRRAIIELMKQDICKAANMAAICRYVGAETIYKIQKSSWGGGPLPSEGSSLDLQMQLLEYGTGKNLARIYAKGLTNAQEQALNGGASSRKLGKLIDIERTFSAWYGCGQDEKALTDTGWFWQRYRLTTCGLGFGFRVVVALFGPKFSAETILLVSNSRFARNVGTWWQTGADPTICADSQIAGSGNQQCRNYHWLSPFSWNFKIILNAPPGSVVAAGKAVRLNQQFSVNLTFQ